MAKWVIVALLAFAPAAFAQEVAYVSQTGGEPWGMPGNVNALDDVFGPGNWDRLNFPTAVGEGLWDYPFIFLEGGDGADGEFMAFVNANRADMEAWVTAGGRMLISAARWTGGGFDVGFGVTLTGNDASDLGHAFDTSHPIYDGPYGFTGDTFDGDWLAHDSVSGGGLTDLMYGDGGPSHVLLVEKPYGGGHVVVGGLTLPFFGEHPLWSDNCDEFHRNLLVYSLPEPSSLVLLLGAFALVRRR